MGNSDSKKEVDRSKECLNVDQSVALGRLFNSFIRIFQEGKSLIPLDVPTIIAERRYIITKDMNGNIIITSTNEKAPNSFQLSLNLHNLGGPTVKITKRTCDGEILVSSLLHFKLVLRGGKDDYSDEPSRPRVDSTAELEIPAS